MIKTRKMLSYCMLATMAATMATSCNNDWEEEQYAHYISFKAPLATSGTSVGVTTVYVPFTRYNDQGEPLYGSEGESHYELPVIVSGSTTNPDNLTVNIAHSDTLPILNYERFGTREKLYYEDMWDYAEVPSTVNIPAGKDVALLKIRFHFNGLDLADRYLLPITIAPGQGYTRNPRKHYATGMLRVLPYTDYSGVYQAGNLKFYIVSGGVVDTEPGGMETVQTYTVSQNSVFFYAGAFNETSLLRHNFKVFAKFEPTSADGKRGNVIFTCENPKMNFVQNKVATFTMLDSPDEVQSYITRRTVIINDVDYTFTDYLTAEGTEIIYNVQGTMAMERKLNTQMPEEDQIIFE